MAHVDSTREPPGWARDLLRFTDPNLYLSWEPWTDQQLRESFGDSPVRQGAAGVSRWVVWERPNPRNRMEKTRVLDVTEYDHWRPRELSRPWLVEQLRALDIRLCNGDPSEWLKRTMERAQKCRDEYDKALAAELVEEVMPVAETLSFLARDDDFGHIMRITQDDIEALDIGRQLSGKGPLTDRQKSLLLHARNPRRKFALGAPGSPAAAPTGYVIVRDRRGE